MNATLTNLKRRLLRHRLSPALYARHVARFPEESWFDPDFYVATYADVKEDIARGRYATPLEHFIRRGLAEGRVTIGNFDEAYYLATYPEVADAVARGEFASAFQHYILFGLANRFSRNGTVIPHAARASAPTGEDLLAPAPRIRDVVIELTTRCNLRCVYCAVSQPTYKGVDMDLGSFDAIVDSLRAVGARTISVNGHGETTIVAGWHRYCQQLIDAGFSLHLITNFARAISDEEAETIARFHFVDVSCDSVEPELFRQLRRGGDLRTLLFNMAKVRATAKRLRIPGPIWKWSCVVLDRNWSGLENLANFGLALGVESFNLKNLVEYDAPPHGEPVHHIATLSPEQMAAARDAVIRTRDAIVRAGRECEIEPGLIEAVDAALAGIVHAQQTSIEGIAAIRFAPTAGERQTRDCFDPWDFAFVHADRSVRPCCMMDRTFGSIATEPLENVLDNEAFRHLRRGLLSGELDPTCAQCPTRPLIPIDEFQAKVEARLRTP